MLACLDLIRRRRTHKRFDGSPLEAALVDELIELAACAPQHRLHEPWRFVHCDPAGIRRLGSWLSSQPQIAAFPDPEKGARKLAKLTEHYFPQLGAMLNVTQLRRRDPVEDQDDLLAVGAAVQNLLLAAEAHGLASFWASSAALAHPDTQRYLGVDPEAERFVGSVWLGGRVEEPEVPPRAGLSLIRRRFGVPA